MRHLAVDELRVFHNALLTALSDWSIIQCDGSFREGAMQQKRQSDEQLQGKALSNSDFPSRSATTRPMGVFILSDVRLCREGLELILARRLNIETVGSASSLNAIGEIVERRPDVVLLDASVADARVLARRICDVMPDTKIIAFALFEIDEEVIACAEAGIIAYIAREGSAEDLIDIVYRAIRGDFVCSPRLTGSLFRHIAALSSERTRSNSATKPEGDDGDLNLTRREKDIIPLIAQGMSNKEIARHLGVEASTIKNHIHNILEKRRLRRRGEIVAQLRPGYIDGRAQKSFTPAALELVRKVRL